MERSIAFRAPARIDFGGGWTDVPPYPERDGGFVCNAAIARYATARIERGPSRPTARAGDAALAAAALRHAGLHDAHATIQSDFPVGAGLGGSSAAGVAIAAAIAAATGGSTAPEALVAASRAVEVEELGIAGGWQDHYAAAYGGVLGIDLRAGVCVERLAISDETRAALERRLVLVYSGESRISGDTITAVLSAYERREAGVLRALARMAALARGMADALRAGDVDALGASIGEHWVHQRALHPAITTARIDAIMSAGERAGALGGKAMGASGGGCVLLVAPDDAVEAVRAAVAPLGEILPFTLDRQGVHACG